MKVSIIIPSKGRAAQLAECVQRLLETTRGHDIEVVIVCDEPDARAAVYAVSGGRSRIVWVNETHKVIPAFNVGLKYSTGDALVLGNDDLWWGDNWLTEALAALETLPDCDGLVGLNDCAPIERDFATFYLMTRRYCARENGGVLACPHYQHNYIDPEACARAIRAGRYVYADKAIVDHRHWLWGKSNKDSTYAEIDPTLEADRAMYEKRAAAGFPDDFPPVIPVPRVWWGVLRERTLYEAATRALEDVATRCALLGYHRIQVSYTATDTAREAFTRKFIEDSQHPDDVLVMLDNDHLHPADVVERLAQIRDVGVVGALCRRRGGDMDELIQLRSPDTGEMMRVSGYEPGSLVVCHMAGGGAMAIKRWVFDALREQYGIRYWFWQYAYSNDSPDRPGEEVRFYRMCEEAGITIVCDTSTVCPHITLITVESLLALLAAAERGEDWRELLNV